MGVLTAVHLSADDSLCILDGDPSLSVIHPNDECDHEDKDDADCYGKCIVGATVSPITGVAAVEIGDKGGYSGDDTCEKDYRDTVADALIVDLLAEPHDKCGTCGEAEDDDEGLEHGCKAGECMTRGISSQIILAAKIEIVSGALKNAEDDGDDSGDRSDLFASLFAFLLESLKSGDSDSEQLHDYRAVDVGGDGHCENGSVIERITGHHVQIIHEGDAVGVSYDAGLTDIGERNGDSRADPEDEHYKASEKHLLTKIGDFPCINKRLEQLDHLCLSSGSLDL